MLSYTHLNQNYWKCTHVLNQHQVRHQLMGGYNSTCEILSFKKKTLIVPRTVPRKEQLIRARSLESKGFVDVLHPDKLSSNNISSWIKSKINSNTHYDFEMNGQSTISNLITDLLHEKKIVKPSLLQGEIYAD